MAGFDVFCPKLLAGIAEVELSRRQQTPNKVRIDSNVVIRGAIVSTAGSC